MTAATRPAAESRFVFFGGKGGVGKTTCAAGAAIVAAERGARVLLISTDPAHALGDVFARRFTARPRRVATRRGTLDVVELDADRALGRWIEERRIELTRIIGRGTYLDDTDIDALLRLGFPGVDELIGLLELTRLAREGAYPEVIVDTAPTGHTLRLLAMPATLQRIAAILDDMQAKHRYLASTLAGRHQPDGADAAVDEIDVHGRALEALLRDPGRACFRWVTLPEIVAMEEARDALAALDAAGIAVSELIVNRMTPPPREPCAACQGRVVYEARALAGARRRFRGRALRLVPSLGQEPRGVAALRRVGRWLAAPAPARPPRRAALPVARPPARKEDAARGRWLDAIAPAGARLIIVAGKGGVGKTTCAAAVALALATRHRESEVLALSADPAHSLGDVLGVALDDTPRLVPGAPAGLRAREIDARRLFADQRQRYRAAVDQMFEKLRGGSRFDLAFDRVVLGELIDLAPPGLDELLGLLSLVDALGARRGGEPRYAAMVLDSAPTGHALRLLAMPATALEWVHTFMGLLLKYRQVIGLPELGGDLVQMSRHLRELQAALRDGGTARMLAVTRAAEIPRLETRGLVAGAQTLGLRLSAVIVNARTGAGCRRCRAQRARERRSIGALRRDLRRLGAGPCAIMEAPAIVPPPRGAAALDAWRQTWMTTEP